MKDPIKVKDLIVSTVDLALVMLSYKVHFIYDPRHADEAQYRCPFHGSDNKPSARFYRATNSCYCWVCRKRWDVVSFIMEKENFSFLEALRYIVSRFNVDTSVIPDEPDIHKSRTPEISDDSIRLLRLQKTIRSFRGKIEFDKYRALCMGMQMVQYDNFSGANISDSLNKIEGKLNHLCLS